MGLVQKLREPWKDGHRRWALERDAADAIDGFVEALLYVREGLVVRDQFSSSDPIIQKIDEALVAFEAFAPSTGASK